MSITICKHDFKYETTIKKTWKNISNGWNQYDNSGSEEKAIFKCTLCGKLKSFGMED